MFFIPFLSVLPPLCIAATAAGIVHTYNSVSGKAATSDKLNATETFKTIFFVAAFPIAALEILTLGIAAYVCGALHARFERPYREFLGIQNDNTQKTNNPNQSGKDTSDMVLAAATMLFAAEKVFAAIGKPLAALAIIAICSHRINITADDKERENDHVDKAAGAVKNSATIAARAIGAPFNIIDSFIKGLFKTENGKIKLEAWGEAYCNTASNLIYSLSYLVAKTLCQEVPTTLTTHKRFEDACRGVANRAVNTALRVAE